jgi:hypothetical protein
MSVNYFILKPYNVLVVRYDGKITVAEINQLRCRFLSDPDFHPSLHQLSDLRDGRLSTLSGAEIRLLAASSLFNSGTKRAFVTSTNLEFGMARMYGTLLECFGVQVQVFRSIEDACEWLGVPATAVAALTHSKEQVEELPHIKERVFTA